MNKGWRRCIDDGALSGRLALGDPKVADPHRTAEYDDESTPKENDFYRRFNEEFLELLLFASHISHDLPRTLTSLHVIKREAPKMGVSARG